MEFRIADTFTASLARLPGDEQKTVKTTAFDLQMNPAQPGMQFHKLEKSRDPNFWSVRVNRDVRLIVHKTDTSLLLCYVDHHNEAYRWAERRKLETHPKTGAAQFVEIRETVQEILVSAYKEVEEQVSAKPRIFEHVADDDLLGYGVPAEWLADVREANEDTLLTLADHLPGEAAEALLYRVGHRRQTTGGSTGRSDRRPVRASGRAASVPRDEQRGRTGGCPGLSLGQVDDLFTSGAARVGRARFQRSGAGCGFGGYGQNDRGVAQGCASGTAQPRVAHIAHNLFGYAVERLAG